MASKSIAHSAFGLMGYWLGARGIIVKDLLGVRSWRHPVVTSACILGLPGNGTVHYHVLFQSAFHFGFLPSKPFFSRESVPLNSCYTEENQKWIGSFPADRCDRLIKSKTGFSSVHPSAVEPGSRRSHNLKPFFLVFFFFNHFFPLACFPLFSLLIL